VWVSTLIVLFTVGCVTQPIQRFDNWTVSFVSPHGNLYWDDREVCRCVLISDNVALTAAHCVSDLVDISVSFDGGVTKIKVRFESHPDFAWWTNTLPTNDIALLWLEEDVELIKPVSISGSQLWLNNLGISLTVFTQEGSMVVDYFGMMGYTDKLMWITNPLMYGDSGGAITLHNEIIGISTNLITYNHLKISLGTALWEGNIRDWINAKLTETESAPNGLQELPAPSLD